MDVHADVGTYGAFGVGLRADIPVVPGGFIDGVDDEFAISPGAEVYMVNLWQDRYNGGPFVMPLVMAQWNFYLGDHWSLFPEAGIAMLVGDARHLPGGRGVYPAFAAGAGFRYHFESRNALLVRVGSPSGLQIGVTF